MATFEDFMKELQKEVNSKNSKKTTTKTTNKKKKKDEEESNVWSAISRAIYQADDDIAPVVGGGGRSFVDAVTKKEKETDSKSKKDHGGSSVGFDEESLEKREKERKEEKNKVSDGTREFLGLDIFQKGALGNIDLDKHFNDGYQVGDVIRTAHDVNKNAAKAILGTAGDVGVEFARGIGNFSEGIADAIAYPIADILQSDFVNDTLGLDTYGYGAGVRGRTEHEYVNEWLLAPDKAVEKWSVFGDSTDSAASGVGQVAAMVGMGELAGSLGMGAKAVGGLSKALMGLSSFGHGITEARKDGASDAEAYGYGLLSAAAEVVCESLFSTMGKVAKSSGVDIGMFDFDDVIAKKVGSLINSPTWRNVAQGAVKGVGEGIEELATGFLQAGAKAITYMREDVNSFKDFWKIVEDENLWEQFFVGMLTGEMVQSVDVIKSNKAGRDVITGLNADEQTVVDKIVEEEIEKAEKDGKKVKKGDIEADIMEKLEKGYISTDDIERILGGDSYNIFKGNKDTFMSTDAFKEYHNASVEDGNLNDESDKLNDESDKLNEEYEALKKIKRDNSTLGDEIRVGEIQKRLGEIQTRKGEIQTRKGELKSRSEELWQQLQPERNRINELKGKLRNEVSERVKDGKLAESYRELVRSTQKFQADPSKYKSEAAKKTIQNLIDGGIANNTNEFREFANLMAKIADDKGAVFDITDNNKLKGTRFAVKGAQVNAFVDENGNITINKDSKKRLNSLVGHEITHVLEGTGFYTELQNAVKQYAQAKGEWDSRLQAVTDLYKKYKPGADPTKELTADLIGDYIFTDKDFVMNLSTKHRNVFIKAWDEVKYLAKIATAGSREARELTKAKKIFEEVWRSTSKKPAKTEHSLDLVDDVQPTSNEWHRTHTTDEVKSQFPELWDIVAEESDSRNPTQIAGTVRSYRKVYDALKAEGFNGTILDASSGMGFGTKAGIEEYGFNVEDIEPYPDKSYNPKYKDYSTLDKKYDAIISNAVLNVLPQEQRDALVVKMGEMLNDGGRIFVNVRGADVKNASSKVAIDESAMEYYIAEKGTYQKGFTKAELVAYLKDALGDGFTVKPTSMFGAVSAVVTKDSGVKHSISDSNGNQLTDAQEEFFKDSVVRDESGNLKVMYHGTSKGGFNVFDTSRSKYGLFGTGFYFTDSENIGQSYTQKGKGSNPQVYEAYLNIKNPLDMDAQANPEEWQNAFEDVDFPESGTNEQFYRALEEYYEDQQIAKWEVEDIIRESIEYGMGYDGITHIGGGRVNADGEQHRVYIAFNPEQIKRTDNQSPTANADIRYSISEETNISFTPAEIQAIQSIGQNTISNFTPQDISATEKLAQRYWEEMGTNSPFYRAWFGDWRANDSSPVQVATKQGDTRVAHFNKDTGWDIQNSGKVHSETKTHKSLANREAVPYLPYIDEIIENAVLLNTKGLRKPKSENSLLMHYLYAVADIGNGPEVLKLTVEEMYDPGKKGTNKRAYDLQNIEKAFAASGMVQGNSPSHITNTANAVNTVADLFSLVKQMEKNFAPDASSKIVNADGTPKVMYHGSPAQFTIFDKSKAKSGGHYGRGFYFTDSTSHAGTYGNLYSVYLNIRNPLQSGGDAVSRSQVRKYLEAVAENEDYSIENYGTYDVDAVLDIVMGQAKTGDAFQIIQDISATAIGDMVEAAELFNRVNGTEFDGIVAPTETVAFYPEQIKSATDNIGTFDKNNPDIRFSISEESADEYSRIYDLGVEINKITNAIADMERSDDFKEQMRKISEAVDAGNIEGAMDGYNRWLSESGYGALRDRRDSLKAEEEQLRKARDARFAQEALDEEKAAIEKSGLSEADYFRKQAVKEFGYTPYFYDAGYIVPNGKMLNFSGEKGKHYGTRGQDHRAIGVIYENTQGSEAMVRFMNDGNIRIMAETPGLDISASVEPTSEQYASIRKFIRESSGEGFFAVDISDADGRNIGTYEYDGRIFADRVVNDIKYFYQNGKLRENSGLTGFLSISKSGDSEQRSNSGYSVEGDKIGIRTSLDPFADFAPIGENVVPVAKNVRPVTKMVDNPLPDDLAPVQQEIERLEAEKADILGAMEAFAAIGDTASAERLMPEWEQVTAKIAELQKEDKARVASLSDADAPPETEAPYYGDYSAPMATPDPFAERNMHEVGNRKVKAYMYENPEVKPFFQDAARGMLGDLHESIRGEKWYNDDVYYESGGENGWYGTKRQTTDDIAELLDQWHYTYDQIEKGLNAIIEDDGAENNAISKRIEFMLHDRLVNGYKSVWGEPIPADQNYIDFLKEREISEYYSEAFDSFMESADKYAPTAYSLDPGTTQPTGRKFYPPADALPSTEEIAPVMAQPTEQRSKPPVGSLPATEDNSFDAPIREQYEAIRPQSQPRMVRVDTPAAEQHTAQILTEAPTLPKEKTSALHKAEELFVDKGAVFERLAKKRKNRELEAKYNAMHYSNGNAQTFIGEGDPDAGVDSLVSVMKQVGDRDQDFFSYMYHIHNMDRMTLAQRGFGEDKAVYGSHVTAEMSSAIAQQIEAQNPDFRDLATKVYGINQYLRQMMVDGGLISQETANLWAKMYPHYVPISRADYEAMGVSVPLDTNKTGVNAPVKRATGGNSDISPMFDTMAKRILQTFRAIDRNDFGVELKNTLNSTIENSATDIDTVIDGIDANEELLQEGKNGNAPTFTVFQNGERVKFAITKEMYDAMKPTDDIWAGTNKALNTISNIRRGLITEYNPVFLATNAIKDAQDVLFNSQHAAATYANFPKAWAEILGNGDYYREYMKHGGGDNTYFERDSSEFAKEKSTLRKVVGFPLDAISYANNFIERVPRLAEYIASREAGRSIKVSMLDAARVTTNFAAGGDVTKWANRNGATFLNASVQGARQLVRNVQEAKMEGLKGWVKLAGKTILAGLPAALLNGLLWEDDEEYEELSDYVKENYYIVAKFGDGQFVRIPKGRTVAVVQEALRQMQSLFTGDDEVDFGKFFQLVLNNIAPNNPLDNNVISPFIQAYTNKAWHGGDIVPQSMQDVPVAEQYDESTDSISKWLGERLNISPMKINYVLDQISGGIGDTILPMLTPEAEGGTDSVFGKFVSPWVDKFTTDSVLNNQNVTDFYDLKDDLTISANSIKATDDDILKSKYMNSVSSELSDLYKQKREIQNSRKYSDSEKYELVRDIQKQINERMEDAMATHDDIEYVEDAKTGAKYAIIGDRYFKLDDEGHKYEWSILSEEEAEKYKITSAAGDANYATDGTTHYRWVEPNEDSDDKPHWTKITDKQLAKQNAVTEMLGITPDEYWSNQDDDSKKMYDWLYENSEKYEVSKAITSDFKDYWEYKNHIDGLDAKDAQGNTVSGLKKERVYDYIESLPLDAGEKAILFKSYYPKDDTYNRMIINYLNSREDISYEEMVTILIGLDFKIEDDGQTITWD